MADRCLCVFLMLACLSACLAFGDSESGNTASSAAPAPAQNSSLIQQLNFFPQTSNSPTRVRGTITFIDSERNLIVLQDGEKATALQVKKLDPQLRVGDEVELEGKLSPFLPAMPEFPNDPSHAGVLTVFETPTNLGNATLSRLRGMLHPPTTGDYVFWIASDDSSELWLSTNENPRNVRQIAQVEIGRFTDTRQWTRYPTQQSQKIHLEADRSYYIDALSQNTSGKDCLAVAWQPPGAEREVIAGSFVSPWPPEGSGLNSSTRGVSWEFWTNFFPRDLSVLRMADKNILRCDNLRILKHENGKMPAPLKVDQGDEADGKEAFRLVDLEGRIDFASRLADGWHIELTSGKSRIIARFKPGSDFKTVLPNNSQVRVRGVFEPTHSFDSDALSGTVWVNDSDGLTWLDTEENWLVVEPLRQQQLTAANSDLTAGRVVHAQGRIIAKESGDLWRLEGKDTFEGYLSADGTNWFSAGVPVEIDMSNNVVAGFALASYKATELAKAQFDHISGLSKSLTGADIGQPHRTGGFAFGTNVLNLQGSGDNIWGGTDQCFFASEPREGNFEMVAHLAEMNSADPQAKAALMIRQSLSSDSPWAAVVLTPGDRAGLQSRREIGKSAAGPLALQTEKWIKLVRRRHSFLVHARNDALQIGQMLDVLGKVAWEGQTLVIDDSRCRIIPTSSESLPNAPALPSGDFHDVRIGELVAEADFAQKTPHSITVRIRGVVTFNDFIGNEWITFVQDKSGSAKIEWKSDTLRKGCRVGDWVEVTGAPVLSGAVPTISANGVTSWGGGEMPEPGRFVADESKRSGVIGQWSEAEGVVRFVAQDGVLLVRTRAGECEVRSSALGSVQKNLLDSRIRIRGVLWRPPKFTVLLPSERYLEIVEAPPDDPFSIPAFSIRSLQMSGGQSWFDRRVKLSGVVTCRRDNFIMVEDASGGARVEMETIPDVKIGEAVEVVGFPSQGEFGFAMSDALLRPSAQHNSLNPVKLAPENLLYFQKNGVLATMEAILLEQHSRRGMQSLDVQAGQRVFRASLPEKDGMLPSITPGSRVKLSGIIVMQHGEAPVAGATPVAGSLELLLRNPSDVAVLERPPWWSWKYTVAVVGVIAAVLIGALLWIRTLRKRVEERTHELRETMGKLEKETRISATLAERDRLAGEIHDSVEQGLSAIMMQMEAAAKLVDQPEEIARYLSMAKNMAGFSRTEVEHAIWHLQSPLLENSDLITALRRVVQDISAGDTPRVTVETSGKIFGLPSTVEHHLLRIAQEAITNAVKHGNPKTISLTLQYQLGAVVLTVRDDGAGFVPEAVSTEGGHFGLQGMRARALKINGEFKLTSNPGQGTSIQIAVPCKIRETQESMTNGTII